MLFTAGSGHLHARAFFKTATELVGHTGCRAVFLTGAMDQLPRDLPDSIFATTYAPFSQLLPRSRLMIHHGGIGTLSQCLKAGVPQLVVAMSLDQPDNAERITKLGAGLGMNAKHFTLKRALPLLRRCLDDDNLRLKAQECAERLRNRSQIDGLMQWLETVCSNARSA